MALLYLIPYHALVIDPNAVAFTHIKNGLSESFAVYTTPALTFSLSNLSSWILQNKVRKELEVNSSSSSKEDSSLEGVCVLISDVQAGVSEDLAVLLTSDPSILATVDRLNDAKSTVQRKGFDRAVSFRCNSFNHKETEILKLPMNCR